MNAPRRSPISQRDSIAIALCWAAALLPFPPLAGPAALVLLTLLPGRLLLRAIGVSAPGGAFGCAALAVAGGLAIVPLLLNPLWHFTNSAPVLVTFVAAALVAAHALLARRDRAAEAPQPQVCAPAGTSHRMPQAPAAGQGHWPAALRAGFAALALLVTFATLATYWPAAGQQGPLPAQIHDFIKHHAVLFSLERRPLPLGDPFFAPDAAGPAYYYHFFYLIPATLRAVAPGITIQLAFGLQAALVGLATMALFALLAARLTGSAAAALLAAAMATAIGGLDVIPLALLRVPAITLDAWADPLVRVHNLLTQMAWAPQHVQGLLIALLAAYFLAERGIRWAGWIALAPLLAAALIGSSVWVSAAFLPAAALLVIPTAASPARRHVAAAALLIAALTLALTTPTLLGYRTMAARLGKSLTLAWPHQQNALLGQHVPPGLLANLLDLPWLLLVELGTLLVLPLLLPREMWRRAWRDPGTRFLMLAALVGLAAFVTVRSHFQYNDFGQKVMMAVQAAGVVLGAGVAAPAGLGGRRWRIGVAALVVLLGLPVALFQTPLATTRRFFPAEGALARLAMPEALRARREAALLRFIRDELPPEAVVQPHWGQVRLELLQMTGRQIGAMVLERDTMVFQVSDPATRAAALDRLHDALAVPGTEPAAVHAALRGLGVTHVVVGEIERAEWANLAALRDAAWFEPVFEQAEMAVYRLK